MQIQWWTYGPPFFFWLRDWSLIKVRKKSYNLLTTGFLLTWSFHWARSFRCYLTQMRLNRPFFCLFFKMRFVYLKQRFTPRGVKYRIPEASTDHFQRLNLFKRSSLAKLFEMTFGWLVSAAPRQLPPLIKCDGQVEAGLKVWQPQPWGGARTVSCKGTCCALPKTFLSVSTWLCCRRIWVKNRSGRAVAAGTSEVDFAFSRTPEICKA